MSKEIIMVIIGWRLYDSDGELESYGVLLEDQELDLDGIHPAISTTSMRHPYEVQKFLDRNYLEQRLKFEYTRKVVEL